MILKAEGSRMCFKEALLHTIQVLFTSSKRKTLDDWEGEERPDTRK
jgi:hypothetical protein